MLIRCRWNGSIFIMQAKDNFFSVLPKTNAQTFYISIISEIQELFLLCLLLLLLSCFLCYCSIASCTLSFLWSSSFLSCSANFTFVDFSVLLFSCLLPSKCVCVFSVVSYNISIQCYACSIFHLQIVVNRLIDWFVL